ncbi:MAG: hypothetical protein V9F06_02020 [Thermomicrobiales bacterium]|jgi:hypothetical protein
MSNMQLDQLRLLADQAEQFRTSCPALYALLAERQRMLRLALWRIPHPDDPEVVRPVAVDAVLIGKLRFLAAGIDDVLAGNAGRSH